MAQRPCCQREQARRCHPLSMWAPMESSFDPPLTLVGWFNNQMSQIQDDLLQNQFFDVPHVARIAFDPQRRSRLFDALFSEEAGSMEAKFHENPNKNQIECQLNTGCGDFFRPEDMELNVKDRQLEFKARREEKSEDGHNYSVREVRRVLTVPENAEMEKLHAEMGPNGKIMLTAPLLQPKPVEDKSQKVVPIKINRS